jgi:hypothetical protein
MIRTALQLAKRGLYVFPCVPRDKVPATANGLKDATTDAAVIKQWWRAEPTCNVAVTCGAASGIFVIDVDGFDGEVALRKFEAEHHALPETVEAITARGRRLYFKGPQTPVRNSVGKVAPGVDVRGEGGYAIVPPSIHPSGRPYAWSVDCGSAFAAAPDWLLAKAIGNKGTTNGASAAEWQQLVHDGVSEGARNSSVTRLAGYLLRRHVDPFVTLDLLQVWNATHCRPPLPGSDISRIVDSICGAELRRRRGRDD